jgi:hypothetical protein
MSAYKKKLKGTDWMSHKPAIPLEELDEYFREDDWPKGHSEPEPEPESEPQESN